MPAELTVAYSPARDHDPTLPRLATREEMAIRTGEFEGRRGRGAEGQSSAHSEPRV